MVGGTEKCRALEIESNYGKVPRDLGRLAVKEHSSGPDVDSGRWPNLDFLVSFEVEDMFLKAVCRNVLRRGGVATG